MDEPSAAYHDKQPAAKQAVPRILWIVGEVAVHEARPKISRRDYGTGGELLSDSWKEKKTEVRSDCSTCTIKVNLLRIVPVQVDRAQECASCLMMKPAVRFDISLEGWTKDAIARRDHVDNGRFQGFRIVRTRRRCSLRQL